MSDENYRIVSADEIEAKLRMAIIEQIPTARLRELADAEREGCVVALPFKIGDKAYWITHFGKMKASGIVVDILIRARDVIVGIDTENGSGTRKSIKDILYFQEAESARSLSSANESVDRCSTCENNGKPICSSCIMTGHGNDIDFHRAAAEPKGEHHD